jgi:hypothetical protein
MVDKFGKLEVATFIIKRQKTSWSELEKQFVSLSSDKIVCPKCKSSDITILEGVQTSIIPGVEPEKTRSLYCKNCRAIIRNDCRIARQTLLNYIKALIKEGIIEKVIDKETLRPIYQATSVGKAKLDEMEIKRKLHSLIDGTGDIRETFQRLKKYIDEKS